MQTAVGAMHGRNGLLVEVQTDVGVSGIGESWVNYPSWAPAERLATLTHGVRPMLLDEVADDPRRLQRLCSERLRLLGLQWGAPGPIAQAISGVELALWDLAGKLAGVPVWQLLGAPAQATVPAYASGLGPARPEEQAAAAVAAGFAAVKLKLGFGRQRDEANLTAVRQAIGDVTLYADANQGWTLAEALALLPALHQAGAAWLEEPLPVDDEAGWRSLRGPAGLPLAGGENLYGRAQFQRWAGSGLLDVIQPDVCKCGGLGVALDVLAAAGRQGRRLAPHYFGGAVGLAATIHLFAALPEEQRAQVEYDVNPNPLREELLTESLFVGRGRLRVPDGPGLGITLRQEALARYGRGGG